MTVTINPKSVRTLFTTAAVAAVAWLTVAILSVSPAQGSASIGANALSSPVMSASRELRPTTPAVAIPVEVVSSALPVVLHESAADDDNRIPASSPAKAVSVPGPTTGSSTNVGGALVAGGSGGGGGVSAVPAPVIGGGATTIGGAGIGVADANGGTGGGATTNIDPTAVSGNSGPAQSSSSATNTGNTGDATSSSSSNPVATSGSSGGTGNGGSSASDTVAINQGIG